MSSLFNPRFNMLDTTLICAFGICFGQGKYMTAFILLVVGVFVVSLLEYLFSKRIKDKQWQSLADTGQKVAAIKLHRQLYGTTLKDALDAVDAYTALKK